MAAEKTIDEKQSKRRRRKKAEDAEDSEPQAGMTETKGRATPGRRSGGGNKKKQEASGNALTRPFTGIINYFKDVRGELDKVHWPTREETIRLTRIVLLTTVASALVLGGLSLFADTVVRAGLQAPIIFAVIFVGLFGATIWYMRGGSSRGGY